MNGTTVNTLKRGAYRTCGTCGLSTTWGAESACDAGARRPERRPPLASSLLWGPDMPAQLPSLAALESNDDGPLTAELRFVRLRSQAAIVRALADHAEHLSRATDTEGVGEQLIEEMARLGCRLLEAADGFAAGLHVEDSRVFTRYPPPGQ
jgi:hypothetical protein